jgi:putative protein-disulfide isomerase
VKHYSFPTRLVNGGLRPGSGAQVLEPNLRSYLLHHWDQVAAASGQPFNENVLAKDGWVYDTEYPARAVVTMRAQSPEDEFSWFKRLQRAFYAEAIDITDPTSYPELLGDFPVDVADFTAELDKEESRRSAWEDFEEARSLQASGFPTLLLRTGTDMATVTRGYRAFDDIEPYLTQYLADRYEPAQFLA